MASEEDDLPHGRVLPLNSRRLKAAHLRALAEQLDLPTSASADETRQLVEGKLEGLNKEPRNVQVIIQEVDDGSASLYLTDEDGVFCRATIDAATPFLVNLQAPDKELQQSTQDDLHDDGESTVEHLAEQLQTVTEALAESQEHVHQLEQEIAEMHSQAEQAEKQLRSELSCSSQAVVRGKERLKQVWRLNCEQVAEYEELLAAKDAELERLRDLLARRDESGSQPAMMTPSKGERTERIPKEGAVQTVDFQAARESAAELPSFRRRGKAPPVDSFTGEEPDVQLDDWLPALQRAAKWNGWTEQELLLQLAGHLRGRALQEWNLLEEEDYRSWEKATTALHTRLDPGSKILAAQDFRHTAQGENETVADFIRRLERAFRLAYGNDQLSRETREAFLYGQLQEGLRYDLMRSPSVSGALTYKELCMAAKNEEKRQAEMRKRKQYHKDGSALRPNYRNPEKTFAQRGQTTKQPKSSPQQFSKGYAIPVASLVTHIATVRSARLRELDMWQEGVNPRQTRGRWTQPLRLHLPKIPRIWMMIL